MKLIVMLVCLATVAWAGHEKTIETNGQTCVCRRRTCEDNLSCEASNCNCVLKKLQQLQNQKNLRYPKSWVVGYHRLVDKRCTCMVRCDKKSDDDLAELCTIKSWDIFICGWTGLAAEILSNCKKGQAEAFFSEIGIINGICLKSNCKPQCSGESNCRAFLAEADLDCIKKAIEATEKENADHEAKHVIGEFGKFIVGIAKARQSCNSHSCPIARKGCLSRVDQDADLQLDNELAQVRARLGPCSGNNALYSLEEKIVVCTLQSG